VFFVPGFFVGVRRFFPARPAKRELENQDE
jgi:hypothetical protein